MTSDLSGMNAKEAIAVLEAEFASVEFKVLEESEYFFIAEFGDDSGNDLFLHVYVANAGNTCVEVSSSDGSASIGKSFAFSDYKGMTEQIHKIVNFMLDME